MKWSFKIGRLLGIDVYLHFTFVLLLAVLGLAHGLVHGSLVAVFTGVAFFLALFGCVLLHEYGHALAARRFGVATHDITLLPIGGVARLERMPEKPLQEIWVALAGPLVNVAIAAALALWLMLSGSWEPLGALSITGGSFAERLLVVNITLVLFNLLPAFPMDGGRVLRALLALRMEYARATRIAATIGQGLAVVLGIAGLFGNVMLVLVALFVWVGATQEAAATEARAIIGDLPVREAMLTDFRTLSVSDTVGDAARLLLQGSQQDFPVVDAGGRMVGIVAHARLFEALREHGDWALVGDVMARQFATASPDERLDLALARLDPGETAVPVISRQGQLTGLLTAENIGELVMLRTARAARPPTPPPLPSANRGLIERGAARQQATTPADLANRSL